jgi:Flp pilus assembly protein TadG
MLMAGSAKKPSLERFPAKWIPVRVKTRWAALANTRKNRNLEPRSDSIGSEKALVAAFRFFTQSTSAVTAIEFALVSPILMILLLGGADLVRYINMARQLTYLANSIATMIAERTTALGSNDATFAFNSALVTFPQVLSDPARHSVAWNTYLSMTLSSIAFTPTVNGCTSGCTYTAAVKWSVGTVSTRSCSVAPLKTPDSTRPSLTTLPQDIYTSGTVIVADVSYPFVPMVGNSFLPSVTLRRSVYLQPRYLPSISNSSGNCP